MAISAALNPASKNLTVSGSSDYPVEVSTDVLTGLPLGGSFTGNAKDMLHVAGPSTQKLLGTIPNPGVPYLIDDEIALKDGSDLTIAAGTEFVFAYGFEVGWNYGKARLTAVGTATAPIIFRGQLEQPGSWTGLSITSSAANDTRFDYVQVEHAGLSLHQPIAVTNSSFSGSPKFGIQKLADDSRDYRTSNTFSGNVLGDIGDL